MGSCDLCHASVGLGVSTRLGIRVLGRPFIRLDRSRVAGCNREEEMVRDRHADWVPSLWFDLGTHLLGDTHQPEFGIKKLPMK